MLSLLKKYAANGSVVVLDTNVLESKRAKELVCFPCNPSKRELLRMMKADYTRFESLERIFEDYKVVVPEEVCSEFYRRERVLRTHRQGSSHAEILDAYLSNLLQFRNELLHRDPRNAICQTREIPLIDSSSSEYKDVLESAKRAFMTLTPKDGRPRNDDSADISVVALAYMLSVKLRRTSNIVSMDHDIYHTIVSSWPEMKSFRVPKNAFFCYDDKASIAIIDPNHAVTE